MHKRVISSIKHVSKEQGCARTRIPIDCGAINFHITVETLEPMNKTDILNVHSFQNFLDNKKRGTSYDGEVLRLEGQICSFVDRRITEHNVFQYRWRTKEKELRALKMLLVYFLLSIIVNQISQNKEIYQFSSIREKSINTPRVHSRRMCDYCAGTQH